MISCLMRYAVCYGIHTHELQLKSCDQTAIVYFLGIFFSEFILVSLVRFCDAVWDSPIYLQV